MVLLTNREPSSSESDPNQLAVKENIQLVRGTSSNIKLYGQKPAIGYDEFDSDHAEVTSSQVGAQRLNSTGTVGRASFACGANKLHPSSSSRLRRPLSPSRIGSDRILPEVDEFIVGNSPWPIGVESVSINSDDQKSTAIDAILVAETRKLLETVSSVYQLMQRMDTSAQAGASSTSLFPLPTQTCGLAPLDSAQVINMNSSGQKTAQILEQLQYEELIDSTRSFPPVMLAQDRDNDVMVDRKRLLNEKQMSIKRIDDLEELLATRKELLTAERVVLEELIAKDEQIEELNRALEVEKMKNAELASSKENYYLKGVADCRSKILDRYPELDLSWMEDSLHGRTNEVPLTE